MERFIRVILSRHRKGSSMQGWQMWQDFLMHRLYSETRYREVWSQQSIWTWGSLIDTRDQLNVKTEFVTTPEEKEFWMLYTSLTQGKNDILMETNCCGFLRTFKDPLNDGMGIVISNLDNRDGYETFESYGAGAVNSWPARQTFSATSISIVRAAEIMPDEVVTGQIILNVDDCYHPLCWSCHIA